MSREAHWFMAGLVAFYGVGGLLTTLAWAFDNFDFFVMIANFWIKETMLIVLISLGYGVWWIVRRLGGRPPRAPLKFLGLSFVGGGVMLVVLSLLHG